jgi:hypothetical protein
MSTSLSSTIRPPPSGHRFDAVKGKIARSLVGSAVGVMVGSDAILHGRVSDVQFEGGEPKLLIAGSSYLLDQILTVIPPGLNQ